MKTILIPCLLAMFSLACTETNLGYVSDPRLPGSCRIGESQVETFDDFEHSEMLDILFVVDASGDSETLLNLVEDAIPSFLSTLEEQNIHVKMGVTTTARNGKVAVGQSANCPDNNTKYVDSTQTQDWKNIAACNGAQKISADEADEPLAVILDAQNSSLWRDRAKRLVVVISRDDDCSGANIGGDKPREQCNDAENKTPLDVFTDGFLKDAKTQEGFTLAIIAGPASLEIQRPVCNSTIGPIYAANRLNQMVAFLGDRAISENLCGNSLFGPLNNIAQKMTSLGTSLCAQKKMSHEPLRVVDGEDRILRLGKDGFIYAADQNECENGAIVFDHSGSRALEEVKVTYCVL